MNHTFAIPARSVMKAIPFETAAVGEPVVKLQRNGSAIVSPVVAVGSASSSISNVVFGGSGPDGVKRSRLPAPSSSGGSLGSATTSRVPATSGLIVS